MGMQSAPSAPPSAFLTVPSSRLLLLLATLFMLGGCASGGGIGKAVNRTLESVGLREADADAQAGIRTVPLRLYAGDNLNAGSDDRALATVVKIYHLRGTQRFDNAAFDSLMADTHGEATLGGDLVQAREVVLTPGMRREFEETLSPDTSHIGVVALFRAPASGRWRYAFDSRQEGVVEEGITIGLHACAMTTGSTALSTQVSGDASSLASARCGR